MVKMKNKGTVVKKIKSNPAVKNPALRLLMISAGLISAGLGVLGMLLPVLPTTPFLLLAAFLFARSSEKLHAWLMNNRLFGKYLKNYLEKKSIPLGVKIYALSLLWVTIAVSIVFFISFMPARILLAVIALAVTWHILSVKTG